MKYVPHDYQTFTTKFIEENSISAILLDMGLRQNGDYITALDGLLTHSPVSKVIIAPLRVARDTGQTKSPNGIILET